MAESILHYSSDAVVEAIEQNLIDTAIALGRGEDAVVFRGTEFSWVYTGFPILNRVLRAQFSEPSVEDQIAEVTECFDRWNAPVSWIVGPASSPTDLEDYLQEAGFSLRETWIGLAADVSRIVDTAALNPDVRMISDADELAIWANVCTDPWSPDTPAAVKLFSPTIAGGLPYCRFYLGCRGNQPMARGMALVKGDVVGLHWVDGSTQAPPQAVATLATRALSDARESGAHLAVIATATAQPWESLGFNPFAQFRVYHRSSGSIK